MDKPFKLISQLHLADIKFLSSKNWPTATLLQRQKEKLRTWTYLKPLL